MTTEHDTNKPCPFCGGDAKIRRREYTGTMASGMEPKWLSLGCPACDVWFSGGEEGKWEHGFYVDKTSEATARAAAKWNTRHE